MSKNHSNTVGDSYFTSSTPADEFGGLACDINHHLGLIVASLKQLDDDVIQEKILHACGDIQGGITTMLALAEKYIPVQTDR